MWKHCDTTDEYISLHDCHGTKVSYQEGILTFGFEDGIWIVPGHPDNTSDKTVRTDEAEVKFFLESADESDIRMYIFEEEGKKTIRKEWEIADLLEHVNSGKGTLEFLYQYKGYGTWIMECWLWSKKKPYHRECELKISLAGAEYCWNDLCEDREW